MDTIYNINTLNSKTSNSVNLSKLQVISQNNLFYTNYVHYYPLQSNIFTYYSSNITPLAYQLNKNQFLSNYPQDLSYIDFLIYSSSLIQDLKQMVNCAVYINIIQNLSPNQVSYILSKIFYHIKDLLTNEVSSHFLVAFIVKISSIERQKFWELIKQDLFLYSTSEFSTFCIQALIKEANKSKKEQKVIVSYFINQIPELCMSKRGNHIVQQILLTFDHSLTKEIVFIINSQVRYIASNIYGICMIKNLIDHSKDIKLDICDLVNFLLKDFKYIITHKTGHCIFIQLIEHMDQFLYSKLIPQILFNLQELIFNRNSCKVINKLYDILDKVRSSK